MKRKLWMFLAAVVLLAVLWCGTAAADTSGTCGDNLTWTLSGTGRLYIRGTGPMPDYSTTNRAPWYNERSSIKAVEVTYGVTKIGTYAFADCTQITSATISGSVSVIRYRAFRNCSSLAEAEIQNRDAVIGDPDYDVFTGCASGFTLRGYMESTAEVYAQNAGYTFASPKCGENLTCDLDADDRLIITGTGDMWNYVNAYETPWSGHRESITSIVLDSGVTGVGNRAFCQCTGLTSVTIPANITKIGYIAFADCSSLSEVTILNRLAVIGDSDLDVFVNCADGLTLRGFNGSSAEVYAGAAGCAFANPRCGENLTWELSTDGKLTISGTGPIADNASPSDIPWYSLRTSIISVEFGNGVTGIGSGAFYSCTGLTIVDIPESITYINSIAFGNCSSLTRVIIRNATATIGDSDYDVFNNCPAGLTLLGWENSTAENYAAVTNIHFTSIAGQCGAHVNWFFDPFTGFMTISGTGAMDDMEQFHMPWKDYTEIIRNVVIGDGVTSIGQEAFCDCTGLTSITIPASVTSIGSSAFCNCTNLTGVTIPDGMEAIGPATFAGCASMTRVTIPDSVTDIFYNAFNGCSSLTSVQLPAGLTHIGYWAFRDCTSLISISIPTGVTEVENECFLNCTGLTGVIVYNPGTVFGVYAFNNCPDLTIRGWNPSTAQEYAELALMPFESIGDLSGQCGDRVNWTFDPVSGLVNITGNGPMWDYEESGALSPFMDNGMIRSAVIGSGVTTVGNYTFYMCTELASVTIPNGVTRIGDHAFEDCVSLPGVTIPNSVTSIGSYAFSWCDGLTGVTIPDGVTQINNNAFYECPNLTSVTIPNSVTSIGDYAFAFCYNLANLTIPNSVMSIGDYAFCYCFTMTSVTIPGSVTSIGSHAFSYCNKLTSVTIPNSVTSIGESAFEECTGLTSVTIPNSVTSIGKKAFYECSSLTSVTIPNSVTSISDSTFGGCRSLTDITIPNSVTSIGAEAFYNCRSLTSVTIPNSVTEIARHTFFDCHSLTSVTIPNGVTSIGVYAFGYTGLTNVTIPNGVTNIGSYAFYSCFGLESATIHNPETVFGGSAIFSGCASGFTIHGHSGSTAQTYAGNNNHAFVPITAEMNTPDFILPAGLTCIEAEAFYGDRMTVVWIPDTVTSLGSKAFAYCTHLTQIRIPASITTIPPDTFQGITKSQLTIFGVPGSAAETFADNVGIQFEVE